MTDRIYYTDPSAVEFDAHVLEIVELQEGRRAAILDRTAFYPTSGGQPFDTGTLDAAQVIDVVDAEDGRILHVIDGTVARGAVHGRVDWPRRFDHMQQHTGQHVLSAAFDRVASAPTVSFHLGASTSTIDLARDVSPADVTRAEDEANRVVWEDRPVAIRFMDADEAARLPLRKEPARGGLLRLIEVTEFDLSACGGTHVARTGAIGLIAIASWERFRGGTRIEFVCGARALRAYRALRNSVRESVRLASVLPEELPAAIERMQKETRDTKRRVKDLETALATHEAAALAAQSLEYGTIRVTIAALDGLDPQGLKTIASAISGRAGYAAVLIGTGVPHPVVVARASDVGLDCAAVLQQLVRRFGGKGGGRGDIAQGGGLTGTADEIVSFAQAVVRQSAA